MIAAQFDLYMNHHSIVETLCGPVSTTCKGPLETVDVAGGSLQGNMGLFWYLQKEADSWPHP